MSEQESLEIAMAPIGIIYNVLEMPILKNQIRMDLNILKSFCHNKELPLFCLTVGETSCNGMWAPVQKQYKNYFTIYQEWCFFAIEDIPESPGSELCVTEMRT